MIADTMADMMADTNASSEVQVVEGPPACADAGGKKTAPAKGATAALQRTIWMLSV
jgi:hypothetical protein